MWYWEGYALWSYGYATALTMNTTGSIYCVQYSITSSTCTWILKEFCPNTAVRFVRASKRVQSIFGSLVSYITIQTKSRKYHSTSRFFPCAQCRVNGGGKVTLAVREKLYYLWKGVEGGTIVAKYLLCSVRLFPKQQSNCPLTLNVCLCVCMCLWRWQKKG